MDWLKIKRKYEDPASNTTLTRSQLFPHKLEIEMMQEEADPQQPQAQLSSSTDQLDAVDEIDKSLFEEYKGSETDNKNLQQRVSSPLPS